MEGLSIFTYYDKIIKNILRKVSKIKKNWKYEIILENLNNFQKWKVEYACDYGKEYLMSKTRRP